MAKAGPRNLHQHFAAPASMVSGRVVAYGGSHPISSRIAARIFMLSPIGCNVENSRVRRYYASLDDVEAIDEITGMHVVGF